MLNQDATGRMQQGRQPAMPRAPRRPRRSLRALILAAAACAPFLFVDASALATITLDRPTSASPHAYFDRLAARPERQSAHSLRSKADLDSLVRDPESFIFQYLWPSDSYPRRQDAAKFFKPRRADFYKYPELAAYGSSGDENIPGKQVLRFPLGISSGSMLITWDIYWGEEFQTNRGTIGAHKTFFLFSGDSTSGGDIVWVLKDLREKSNISTGEVSVHATEFYAYDRLGVPPGQQLSGDIALSTGAGAAAARSFPIMANRWTRYWLEIRLDVPGSEFKDWSREYLGGAPLSGTWDMASLWIADEQRNPVRVVYRVPLPRSGSRYSEFRFAFDTSSHNLVAGTGATGPLIGYARNLVVLQNVAVDESNVVAPPVPNPTTDRTAPDAPRSLRIVSGSSGE